MATTKGKETPAKRTTVIDGRRAEEAMERINASLDAAQQAAHALRKDLRRGRKDMTKDLERMIAATRRDAGKLGKAIRADVAEFQKAVSSPPARPRAKAGPTRARTTRTTTTAARKPAPAKRPSAKA